MNKLILFLSVTAFLFSCKESVKGDGPYSELELNSFKDKISYAVGADMAANFQRMPDSLFVQLDKKEMENGFVSGYSEFNADMRSDCELKMKSVIVSPSELDTTEYSVKDLSFCYGALFGGMTKETLEKKKSENDVDLEVCKKGFAQGLVQVDTLIELDERSKMIQDFYNDKVKSEGEKLLAHFKSEDGVKEVNDFVLIREVSPGNGTPIEDLKEYEMFFTVRNTFGDTIISSVYTAEGGNENNTMLLNKGESFLVQGWHDALPEMSVNGEYELLIKDVKAFGANGLQMSYSGGYVIQPYETLLITSKVVAQNEIGSETIKNALTAPNAKKYAEGYVIETLLEGTGAKVPQGADVKAHYILFDGQGGMIQNSYQSSGEAPAFSLNGVVRGWTLAIPQMKKGGRYRLTLPYELGYGVQGQPQGGIKPYETLVFEIEVVDFGKPGTLVKPRPMGM